MQSLMEEDAFQVMLNRINYPAAFDAVLVASKIYILVRFLKVHLIPNFFLMKSEIL